MHLKIITPKQAINKAYLREKVNRADIELFKAKFTDLLDKINDKGDEEHLKSLIADLLKFTWYKDAFQINPIGKNDLVIHTGKSPSDPIGVILEVKSVVNKTEMISGQKPNAKAIHELVLYYLNERITNNKHEIKQLIATNIFEWFVFDANEFDKKIYRNTSIKKLYEQKKADHKDNPWFYEEIRKLLDDQSISLEATHFDIRDYKNDVQNNTEINDKKLIPLFKILSPVHLLKLSFANDSNTLQPKFYSELLHLIGLYEYKEGSKKLISRKKEGERNAGSLLENAIVNLDSHDKISRLDKPMQYGETYPERLYNVALELVITWINRILFLKLLEAQLLNYHKGDKTYTFLNKDKIRDFDDLDKLFFRVLAKKTDERSTDIVKLFGKVPYLNSSLFEPTELEHQTLFINGLEYAETLPFMGTTVLKDRNDKARKGSLNTLDYIFDFLNAYDFSSEGAEEIQEDNKTLINASVLGLIFEKINGYKDGSFFTPGFITMYMCRETIRRAVVQKFNETKNWELKDYSELYDQIKDKKEANTIINSLKICDPAVGSGHFLVSALNEIIAIKSDLKVLMSSDGRTLRDHHIEVVNDELIVTDDNNDLFKYNYLNPNSQTVQRTLFYEKQTIIENCLFGVDINPNSVKICRLRLWIELLKNAYYKTATNGQLELETLPNIDINIKTGNSLISRFALDVDLKQALKKNNIQIETYRNAVDTYRNARDKAQKREMENIINAIKNSFTTEISRNGKEYSDLSKLRGQLQVLISTNHDLFGIKRSKKELELEQRRLELSIEKQEQVIEEIKNNKIYENAFEWRFEFPEVLNNEGDFVGFDVVIGNPPYIRVQDLHHSFIDNYKENFKVAYKRIDISILFIEQGVKVLTRNGVLTYITSNQFLKAEYGRNVRAFLKGHIQINIDYSKVSVFDGLATYVSVLQILKEYSEDIRYKLVENIEDPIENFILFGNDSLSDDSWDFNINESLKQKIFAKKITLNEIANFTYGVITGLDKAFLVENEKVKELFLEEEITKAFIRPQNYKKYQIKNYTYSLIYPYRNDNSIINEDVLKKDYPNCYSFLNQFKSQLENRQDSRTTIKQKGVAWYSLMRKVDIKEINNEKIIFYDVGMLPNFILDNSNYIFGGGTSHSFRIVNKLYNNRFLLGILNSRLMQWIIYDLCPAKMGNARKYGLDYIKKLPIPSISSADQLPYINLVDQILEQKQLGTDTLSLENQIDQLVYQLYNLTEEEIKIVEDAS